MNSTLRTVLHWGLNVALMLACLVCVYLGFFSQNVNVDVFDRVMSEIVGVAFGVLAFFFTKKTITQG